MNLRQGVLVLAIAAFGTSCSAPQLFDGRSLEGWSFFLEDPSATMEDTWSVQDGILVCTGEPLGYLYTQNEFTSFRLVVEWRWAADAQPPEGRVLNSGVLMRINGTPRPIPRCIEAQLKSENAGDLYGFHGMTIHGAKDRLVTRKNDAVIGDMIGVTRMETNENPLGEWNTYEIVADGPNVTVVVNGKTLNEATDCDVLAGPIGLQSEGGEIHFRRVELTPLP